MRIKRMAASFGCLNGRELELSDGLNIIYAPNESGKSTWCAFIRAMLYGIDSSERERAGWRPDKVKYLPWSGAPMEGVMDIEYSGGKVTISRRTRTATAPMREFSATYTGTAEPVPGLTGSNAGEELLGVPRSVFERSAFIRQSGLAIDGSPELERRIAAIVSTGEEGASYTETDERLRAWLRRRRHNKSGRLPELDARIDLIRRSLADLNSAAAERAQLYDELCRVRDVRDSSRQALENELKACRETAISGISAGREEVARRESELADATGAQARCHERLCRGIFGDSDPDDIRESVLQSADELEFAGETAGKAPSPLLWIIPLLLSAGSLIAGFFVSQPLLAAGAVMFILALAMFIRHLAVSKKVRKAGFSCEGILSKYGAVSRREMLDAFSEHERLYGEWSEARTCVEAAAALLARARDAQAELENRLLLGLEQSSPGVVRARRALEEAEASLDSLVREWAVSEGRCKALGDPLVLNSELGSLEDTRRQLAFQYDALALAVEAMRGANEEIQNRFSPRLGYLATEFMSALTCGRYDELLLDRNFAANARLSGDTVSHEAAFLSEGTVGQLYLALRLAICELALPGDDTCPIILDDALVDFDEDRTARALELLEEMSKKRQVILFTCHKYE